MTIIRVDKTDEHDVFCGRPSKFSNPFKLKEHGNRAEILNKFEAYFKALPNLDSLLDELADKRVACWCKTDQKCHIDIIIKLYNARRKDRQFADILY